MHWKFKKLNKTSSARQIIQTAMPYVGEDFLEIFKTGIGQKIIDFFDYLQPVTLAIAAYEISNFYYRFAAFYRHKYFTATQEFSLKSLVLPVVPLILLLFLCIAYPEESPYFSFSFLSSLIIMFYPLLSGQKIVSFSSTFPLDLLFCSLTVLNKYFKYCFIISIILSFVVFVNERDKRYFFHRMFVFPYLLVAFMFMWLQSPQRCTVTATNLSYVGAFLGFLSKF